MSDKVQKIREEVEKLKSQLLRGACSSQIAMETHCKEEAYNEVLTILGTMQEENVSEDLEEAAVEAFKQIVDSDKNNFLEIFKAGAKWQKEQMMKDALDAEVQSAGYFIPLISLKNDVSDIKFGDKIKIIIFKK